MCLTIELTGTGPVSSRTASLKLPFKVRAPAIATRSYRKVFLKKDTKTFETFETLCGCCHQAAPR